MIWYDIIEVSLGLSCFFVCGLMSYGVMWCDFYNFFGSNGCFWCDFGVICF